MFSDIVKNLFVLQSVWNSSVYNIHFMHIKLVQYALDCIFCIIFSIFHQLSLMNSIDWILSRILKCTVDISHLVLKQNFRHTQICCDLSEKQVYRSVWTKYIRLKIFRNKHSRCRLSDGLYRLRFYLACIRYCQFVHLFFP